MEGEQACDVAGGVAVEEVVVHAGEVGHLGEDVDEDLGRRERRGREVEHLGFGVGFGDPGLEFGVEGQVGRVRVVGCYEGGDEAPEGGDDGVGVLEEGEVGERGAVGAVQHAAAHERFAEVVASEAAGDGGVELVDKVQDGGVVDCGGLVEETAGVEQGHVADGPDGVGLIHYCMTHRVSIPLDEVRKGRGGTHFDRGKLARGDGRSGCAMRPGRQSRPRRASWPSGRLASAGSRCC